MFLRKLLEQSGELLFDAVNDTLRQVFGEYASKLILNFVERSAFLKREAVDEEIEAIYGYLERLIGSKERGLCKLPVLNVCVLSCGESTWR